VVVWHKGERRDSLLERRSQWNCNVCTVHIYFLK
jgi:hypothetical protein